MADTNTKAELLRRAKGEMSGPDSIFYGSRFHPDPSLCSECRNIRVDYLLSDELPSFRGSEPKFKFYNLRDIHRRQNSCKCCEVIFNINRNVIRWRTSSAINYPFRPLDEPSINEAIETSQLQYISDLNNRKHLLLCSAVLSGDSCMSGIEALALEKPFRSPDHSSSPERDSPRLIERNMNVNLAATKVQDWLEDCNENDGYCSLLRRGAMLPDRILDIGTMNKPHVRLLEPHLERGDYVALSYCWGSMQRYITTAETLQSFLNHVEEDKLPSTIQDAIRLTRALRIRYIWIDSLCIIQGSRQDWEKQSAKMNEVYSRAFLTICASRASGATEGFFGERPAMSTRWGSWDYPRTGKQVDVFLSWNKDGQDMSDILADEQLSSRGWAVQERLLSPRKVFFTSQQMIWQCSCFSFFEDGTDFTRSFDRRGFSGPVLQTSYSGWKTVVHNFTQCNLTEFSDRLPALSGIAKIFADILQDDYLAGHWRKDFPYSLMWRKLRTSHDGRSDGSHSTVYTSPSWSWASAGVGVQFLREQMRYGKKLVKVLGAHVEVTSPGNRYGQVRDGWVELEAPVLPVRVVKDNRNGYRAFFNIGDSEYQLNGDETAQENNDMWLDGYEDSLDAIAVFFHEVKFGGHEYYGLLITASESGQETYVRRGGFFECAIFPNLPIERLFHKTEYDKGLNEVDQISIRRVKII